MTNEALEASAKRNRAMFEKWADERGMSVMRRHAEHGYIESYTDHMWCAWQAAIAAYLEASWQPIETAPKDGTVVYLCRGKRVTAGNWESVISTSAEYHSNGTYLGQYEDGDSWEGWISWDGGFTEEEPPTHWMPIPKPPAIDAMGEKG
jgi:hypothetical protein